MTQPDIQHQMPADVKPVSAAPAIATNVTRYLMLPHVRAGGIAGLLEILVDHGGREDLHRISHQLMLSPTTCCRSWAPAFFLVSGP